MKGLNETMRGARRTIERKGVMGMEVRKTVVASGCCKSFNVPSAIFASW